MTLENPMVHPGFCVNDRLYTIFPLYHNAELLHPRIQFLVRYGISILDVNHGHKASSIHVMMLEVAKLTGGWGLVRHIVVCSDGDARFFGIQDISPPMRVHESAALGNFYKGERGFGASGNGHPVDMVVM